MNNIQNQLENAPVALITIKPKKGKVTLKEILKRKFFKKIVKASKPKPELSIAEQLIQWARSVQMESKIGGSIYQWVRRINADGNRLIKCGNLGFQEVVKGEVAFPVEQSKKRVIVEEEINDDNFAEKLEKAAEKHAADQKVKKERKKKPKKEPKFKVPKESGRVIVEGGQNHRGGKNEDPLWRHEKRVGHRTKDWDAAVTFIDGWDEKNPKRNGTNSWDRWDTNHRWRVD